jgi:hypothetical protein
MSDFKKVGHFHLAKYPLIIPISDIFNVPTFLNRAHASYRELWVFFEDIVLGSRVLAFYRKITFQL